MPGTKWIRCFLHRHKHEIGERLAANIKHKRAEVTRQSINEYFDNLELAVKDVAPSKIFNYDESNFVDDPGKKLSIFNCGTKYPTRIMDYSKSVVSVMFCTAADETMLPPYIVYKSSNLWDTWCTGGIKGYPCCSLRCCTKGFRYNNSKSG